MTNPELDKAREDAEAARTNVLLQLDQVQRFQTRYAESDPDAVLLARGALERALDSYGAACVIVGIERAAEAIGRAR